MNTGCAAPTDATEDEVEANIGTTQAALRATELGALRAGTRSATAVPIAPDTVLVVGSAFPASQDPRQLFFTNFTGAGSTAVRDIVRHPTRPIALVKLPSASVFPVQLNTESMQGLVGRTIRCDGVNANGNQ